MKPLIEGNTSLSHRIPRSLDILDDSVAAQRWKREVFRAQYGLPGCLDECWKMLFDSAAAKHRTSRGRAYIETGILIQPFNPKSALLVECEQTPDGFVRHGSNAALYVVFALWCTLKAMSTAANLGYSDLNNSERSEYLVIYGGLQVGLAVMFFLLARDAAYQKVGIMISVGVYAPIVLYRLATIWKFSPVSQLTMYVGALETVLLISAVWVALRSGAFGR